jgi:predicted DNA-binding protein
MIKKGTNNRTQINATIDPELKSKLKEISSETGIPVSKLLDRAIKLLIEDMDKREKLFGLK